jgi:hypothetical protein
MLLKRIYNMWFSKGEFIDLRALSWDPGLDIWQGSQRWYNILICCKISGHMFCTNTETKTPKIPLWPPN